MPTYQTFLQLSPEFGGTKFGPFMQVEIRLGSDPSNNDIVLPETLGVSPQHVKVIKQPDNSYVVAPTERTAAVFVFRADGRPPKQIQTPVACQANDGFSLVTAEGVRFTIVQEEEKPKSSLADAKKKKKKKGQLTVGNMIEEIKTLGLAHFMRTNLGHMYQTGYAYIVSGAILKPRNIVLMLAVVSGWIFAGGIGCTAFKLSSDKGKVQSKYEECEADKASMIGTTSSEEPTVPQLTQQILKDTEWNETLDGDAELRKRYMAELQKVFQRRDKYKWVYKQKKSEFVQFKKALENKGMSEELARIFAYAAAPPGYIETRDWSLIKEDSRGMRACGRGAAMVSYRQAKNLGFSLLQVDALVTTSLGASDDVDALARALKETAGSDPVEFKNDQVKSTAVALQGEYMCAYVEGDDDRADVTKTADALGTALGDKAKGVPAKGEDYWIAARMLKFYAADYIDTYASLDFSSEVPTRVIADAATNAAQKEFVFNSSAEVIARAVAIPCLAILDKEQKSAGFPDFMGAPPTLVQCGILNLLVDRDSF